MKKPLFNQEKYLDAFIKTAQYLASLTSQQDAWSEIGKVMTSFFGADLAGFAERRTDGEITGHHWTLPDKVPCESILTVETKGIVAAVLESGFLATHQINTPEEYSLAILPVSRKHQTIGVMLAGHRMSEPLPKELLNIYLAVAGLAGTTIAKLAGDEALRESEERYRDLFENANDLIQCSKLDGTFLYVNPAWRRTLGYTEEEIPSLSMFDIIHPDSKEHCMEVFQRLMSGEELESIETVYVTREGKYIAVEGSSSCLFEEGKPVATRGIFRDITDRKRAEEKIRTQSKFLQTAIDALTHPFYTINVKDYSISLFNKAAGIHLSEESPTCYALTHGRSEPCRKDDHPCPIEEIKVTGRPTTVEHIHLDKNGNKRIIEIDAFPIFDKEGNLSQIIEYSIDITERKKAEAELIKHREQLEDLVKERTNELEATQEELVKHEKLAVLGQLAATVSHELRNPLGVIQSSTFYVESKLSDVDEKIIKHLKRIDEQVGLCDSIVGDLLEYTRGRLSEKFKGDLNTWLERVLNEISIPNEVSVVRELYPGLPVVPFDRDKLQRVLINLVNNAVQAVVVRQEDWKDEEGPYQPQVKVTTFMVEDGVCIEVEDNGIGMDEETVRCAFEPLFTTKARGTGLELAIIKKIVEEHGGSVSLKSEPGCGTKAIVEIPSGPQWPPESASGKSR